jgi:hypothetical protein
VTYNVVVAAMAIGVFAIGHWGSRHVTELVPSTFTVAARERKLRQYRRGSVVCRFIAVVLLVYAVGRIWHGA